MVMLGLLVLLRRLNRCWGLELSNMRCYDFVFPFLMGSIIIMGM